MKNPSLNIPEIQQVIQTIHRNFLDNLGTMTQKVEADHRWLMEIVNAKVFSVVTCLKNEKVIDEAITKDQGTIKEIHLTKKGYSSGIIISTDGRVIVIRDGSLVATITALHALSLPDANDYMYLIDGECDWVEFTKILLDNIHSKIYGRKQAAEARLTGMIEVNSKEEL